MDEDILRKLEERLGPLHARQRLGIETDHEAQIFGQGLLFFHIENWYPVHSVIRNALKLGEGRAGLARRRTGRTHTLSPSSRRAAPPICSDLIYDRDNGKDGGRGNDSSRVASNLVWSKIETAQRRQRSNILVLGRCCTTSLPWTRYRI